MCAEVEVCLNQEGVALEEVTCGEVREVCQPRQLCRGGDVVGLLCPCVLDAVVLAVHFNGLFCNLIGVVCGFLQGLAPADVIVPGIRPCGCGCRRCFGLPLGGNRCQTERQHGEDHGQCKQKGQCFFHGFAPFQKSFYRLPVARQWINSGYRASHPAFQTPCSSDPC